MIRLSAPLTRLLLTFAGMAGIAAAGLAVEDSSAALVRARNSLVADIATEETFDWRPGSEPADFLLDRQPPSTAFAEFASTVQTRPETGWPNVDTALALARALEVHRTDGVPIRSLPTKTLEQIIDEGHGYCSDYARSFLGLTEALSVPAREWGLGFDGFGRGHAFNEVFEPKLDDWVMIDPFYSMYVRDATTGEPLSALEFRARLADGTAAQTVKVVQINPDRFGFTSEAEALDYYTKGDDQFYVSWGNNLFSYEHNPVVHTAGLLAHSLEQLSAIIVGVYPHIHILSTSTNAELIGDLRTTRNLVIIGLLLELALATYAGVQIVRVVNDRVRRESRR